MTVLNTNDSDICFTAMTFFSSASWGEKIKIDCIRGIFVFFLTMI